MKWPFWVLCFIIIPPHTLNSRYQLQVYSAHLGTRLGVQLIVRLFPFICSYCNLTTIFGVHVSGATTSTFLGYLLLVMTCMIGGGALVATYFFYRHLMASGKLDKTEWCHIASICVLFTIPSIYVPSTSLSHISKDLYTSNSLTGESESCNNIMATSTRWNCTWWWWKTTKKLLN